MVYVRNSELKILSTLAKHGPLTWSELLEKTKLPKSTLSVGVRRLRKMGFVKTEIKEVKDKPRVAYTACVREALSAEIIKIFEEDFVEIEKAFKSSNLDRFFRVLIESIAEFFYVLIMIGLYHEVAKLSREKYVSTNEIEEIKGFYRKLIADVLENYAAKIMDILFIDLKAAKRLLLKVY